MTAVFQQFPSAYERELDPGASAALVRRLRHDLRTPVNHIIGYSEMLIEELIDVEQPVPPELTNIRADGQGLLQALSDGLHEDAPLAAQLSALHLAATAPLSRIRRATVALAAVSVGQRTADLARIADAAARLDALLADEVSLAPPPAALTPLPTALDTTLLGRLLVVDDDPGNREMLARRLDRLGHTTVLAANGPDALALLRAQAFDLMLLDLLMPEMDGYEVLEAVKADSLMRHVPVILLSAADEVGNIARGLALGAEDYLPKPFDPVLLHARITSALQRKRLHDQERTHLAAIEREKDQVRKLLEIVIPIGELLSKEKNFDRLLERIVIEAQTLCNADGGSLYLRTPDETLRWVIVRNTSLQIANGGTSAQPVTFAPLPLFLPDGTPNNRYVVVHTALAGESVNIVDAYDTDTYDFSGTRAFDRQTGYRTRSLINAPLKGEDGRVIGVLQLLNATDPETGVVGAFDSVTERLLESLARLAAVALVAYSREQHLQQQIAALKIEIDQTRQARQVEEITSTEYFQQLQQRARQLRNRTGGGSS